MLIVFVLFILHASTPLLAAPARQVDESRNFDAVIVDRNSAQLPKQFGARAARDCRSGQLIDLSDGNFGARLSVGHAYHFENAWIYEGNPGQLFFLLSNSQGFRYSEISGCPSAPPPSAPPNVNFSVNQNTLPFGQCATLRWDVDNVRAVYVDGQGVGGHDSRQVCPSSTTTYNLRAVTSSGDINRSVTVNVQFPSPTPVPPAQIVFSVDRTDIAIGECVTLNWALAYVQSWSLDNAAVPNPGKRLDCPKATTTYTLRALSASGSLSRSVTVTVSVPILRLADFTLLDPAKHASLTDFAIMDNPTALSTRILWIQIANDGGPVSNASYELQVVLKGAHGEKLAEYDFVSGSPLSLAPITLGNSMNIQNVFVPISFTDTVQAGNLEVFLKPDPALNQRNSILSKRLTPAQPSLTAKKIQFAANQSTFTDLEIVGSNQYGVETTWTDPDSYPKRIAQTDGYWWQDTTELTFYITGVGLRGCIIDYLPDSPDFDTVDIVYAEGKGCSGGGGSAGILIPEEALRDYRSASTVMLPFKCLKSVAKQVTGEGNVIFLSWDCVISPGIKIAELIAAQYGKQISPQKDTTPATSPDPAQTNGVTQPTSSPSPASPTASPVPPAPTVPPPPPGVYVTKIRMEPPNPNIVEDTRFFVTFWNTAGPLRFKWCVYIYNDGAQNPRGQTTCDSFVDFPLGVYEYATPNTWKLGPGSPCADLIARVQGIETDGARLIFKTPDFSENSFSFRVWP